LNVFYEEDGGFKVAAVMSESDASMQVEAAHGKRSKIKAQAVLLKFDRPPLSAFMAAAEEAATAIDLDFLWEVAPQEEFAHETLAVDYFGHAPSAVESAALLMRLHGAPMYFYKKGRGRYRPAPADALKAALASVERKKREAVLQEEYTAALCAFRLPDELRAFVPQLLFKPDRQSVAWKALDAACAATALSAPRLMHRAGALAGPYAYFHDRFTFEHFPRGTAHAPHPAPTAPGDLPLADVTAFSIDDSSTTEIDDAFSVSHAPGGRIRIGIHIAAPALGFAPESALDHLARDRMSTVYMPGGKITMLPDDVVAAFTLEAGREMPCVSVYLDVEPADMAIAACESRVERVAVAANLRHDRLDAEVTAESLDAARGAYPFAAELATLWRLVNALEKGRGKAGGGQNFRDYSFAIDWPAGADVDAARVSIGERRRGAPLDKIVSELMIFANHTWGRLLADRGAAGIYRVKTGAGPAGKVRMTSVPAPHIGLGVSHYAWSSSPLRRYVDLVNQWQLIAVLSGAKPPFGSRSEMLLSAIAAFDAAYTAYADFQSSLERYWTLRWLAQEGYVGSDATLEGTVTRDGGVRLEAVPLGGAVAGIPALAGGARIQVRVRSVDYWQLGADLVFAGVIAAPPEENSAAADEAEPNTD
jgi:exoribonuclease-2